MSLNNLRCELRWERPESELGLQADLAIARMLLALPARWKPAAMQQDALGNHWEFEPLPGGLRFGPAPGAAPSMVVTFDSGGDDAEEFSDMLDVEQDVRPAESLWPGIRGLRELVSSGRFAARFERFLRSVIRDREQALNRLSERPFETRLAALQRRLHLSAAETAVLVMCTNRFRLIDSAALRRFDLKIRFGWLTPAQRLALFDQVAVSISSTGADPGGVRDCLAAA